VSKVKKQILAAGATCPQMVFGGQEQLMLSFHAFLAEVLW
jgi:hypothetical protein